MSSVIRALFVNYRSHASWTPLSGAGDLQTCVVRALKAKTLPSCPVPGSDTQGDKDVPQGHRWPSSAATWHAGAIHEVWYRA